MLPGWEGQAFAPWVLSTGQEGSWGEDVSLNVLCKPICCSHLGQEGSEVMGSPRHLESDLNQFKC